MKPKHLDVRIRFKLKNRMGSAYGLDVRTDDFGRICYNHYAWDSHMGHAISNMSMQRDLPSVVFDYQSVNDLVAHLIAVIESGSMTVDVVVHKLSKKKDYGLEEGY